MGGYLGRLAKEGRLYKWKGTARVAKTNTTKAKTNKNKSEPSYVNSYFQGKPRLSFLDIVSATMEHQQPDHVMREEHQDHSFNEQNVSQEMSEEGWRALAYVHSVQIGASTS